MELLESPATVSGCWRYPVKSFQGLDQGRLELTERGIDGDRAHAVIDNATGRLLTAKRVPALLGASATDHALTLPDRTVVAFGDPSMDAMLSAWLGRDVHLAGAGSIDAPSFDMTFDPPNDDAEVFEIPTPPGTFVDICGVHIITTATMAGCAEARPDLDWDLRRFRPNVLVDVDGPAFAENAWIGHEIAIGTAVLRVGGPMLRCAMPLRAQPGLDREPGLFKAMSELHEAFPNHLGLVADVVTPGVIRPGDTVTL